MYVKLFQIFFVAFFYYEKKQNNKRRGVSALDYSKEIEAKKKYPYKVPLKCFISWKYSIIRKHSKGIAFTNIQRWIKYIKI